MNTDWEHGQRTVLYVRISLWTENVHFTKTLAWRIVSCLVVTWHVMPCLAVTWHVLS
jgi:hypothetical protein